MILQATSNDKFGIIPRNKKSGAGFTLIELLLVIGVTLILSVASVPIYGNLMTSSQLNESTSQIIQSIRIAREQSIAGINNTSHGVFFEINSGSQDRFILYQGTSYAGRDSAYDLPVILDKALSLTTTIYSSQINFSKGLGIPNRTGTITLTHGVTGVRIMDINDFGIIEEVD